MPCPWVRGGGLEVRGEDPLIDYIDLGPRHYDVMFTFHAGRCREPASLRRQKMCIRDLESTFLNGKFCNYYFSYVYETISIISQC